MFVGVFFLLLKGKLSPQKTSNIISFKIETHPDGN
jgi:hypothetical protein